MKSRLASIAHTCAQHLPHSSQPPRPGWICLVALLALSLPGRAQECDGDRLDEYVRELEAHGFAGAVSIVCRGDVVLERGYGLANRAAGIENTARTPFYLASVSKQFTGTAALLAETAGLRLGATIDRYLADVPADKVEITIEQLLTHTAGLEEYHAAADERISKQEAIRRILSAPLVSTPGSRYAYSNAGYTLLAAIVEEVVGMAFEDFLRAALFVPAGLRGTRTIGRPEADEVEPARGYPGQPAEGQVVDRTGSPWAHLGSGGVLASVRDLRAWIEALDAGAVASRSVPARLIVPRVQTRGGSYGYGWRTTDVDYGGSLVFHFGSEANGHGAAVMRWLDRDIVVVVLSNVVTDETGYASRAAIALSRTILDPDFDGRASFMPER